MNYIKKLEEENKELKKMIQSINDRTKEHLQYLSSPKFRGIDNDFCHVSTDIYWKIYELKDISTLYTL